MAVTEDDGTRRVPGITRDKNSEYQVIVFGAAGVGKSTIINRFVNETFRDNYYPTIEDTYRKVISANKQVCTLQIIDTAGSHQFPAMTRLNMTTGHAFILVYSVANRQSVDELKPIITELRQIKQNMEGIPVMLVGNKTDLTDKRRVSMEQGERRAKELGVLFIESSAKTGHNVKQVCTFRNKCDNPSLDLGPVCTLNIIPNGQNW